MIGAVTCKFLHPSNGAKFRAVKLGVHSLRLEHETSTGFLAKLSRELAHFKRELAKLRQKLAEFKRFSLF